MENKNKQMEIFMKDSMSRMLFRVNFKNNKKKIINIFSYF